MSIDIGSVLREKYRIVEPLACGGMGAVYKAQSLADPDFKVAVKVLDESLAKNPDLRHRFRIEALIGYRVSNQYVAKVYEFFDEMNVLAFAMELVEGGTLSNVLEQNKPSIDNSLRIIWEIGCALKALHAQGIVHRDIKPENILLTNEMAVRVCDFGLATLPGDTLGIDGGKLAGTPRYVPPEYVEKRIFCSRGDIYSWGAIAYECLAGVALFDGQQGDQILHSKMEIHGQDLLSRNEAVSASLAMWVMRCLSPLENRFQKVEHALDGLQNCLSSYTWKPEKAPKPKSVLAELLANAREPEVLEPYIA